MITNKLATHDELRVNNDNNIEQEINRLRKKIKECGVKVTSKKIEEGEVEACPLNGLFLRLDFIIFEKKIR